MRVACRSSSRHPHQVFGNTSNQPDAGVMRPSRIAQLRGVHAPEARKRRYMLFARDGTGFALPGLDNGLARRHTRRHEGILPRALCPGELKDPICGVRHGQAVEPREPQRRLLRRLPADVCVDAAISIAEDPFRRAAHCTRPSNESDDTIASEELHLFEPALQTFKDHVEGPSDSAMVTIFGVDGIRQGSTHQKNPPIGHWRCEDPFRGVVRSRPSVCRRHAGGPVGRRLRMKAKRLEHDLGAGCPNGEPVDLVAEGLWQIRRRIEVRFDLFGRSRCRPALRQAR